MQRLLSAWAAGRQVRRGSGQRAGPVASRQRRLPGYRAEWEEIGPRSRPRRPMPQAARGHASREAERVPHARPAALTERVRLETRTGSARTVSPCARHGSNLRATQTTMPVRPPTRTCNHRRRRIFANANRSYRPDSRSLASSLWRCLQATEPDHLLPSDHSPPAACPKQVRIRPSSTKLRGAGGRPPAPRGIASCVTADRHSAGCSPRSGRRSGAGCSLRSPRRWLAERIVAPRSLRGWRELASSATDLLGSGAGRAAHCSQAFRWPAAARTLLRPPSAVLRSFLAASPDDPHPRCGPGARPGLGGSHPRRTAPGSAHRPAADSAAPAQARRSGCGWGRLACRPPG